MSGASLALSCVYNKKKARSGSGLNLSLEENRGDMSIMLHRKIEIQFIFAMIVIDGLNNTAETA
jgi:hypothetical protein